jgi:uncharacterized protein YkwD
MTPTLIVLLTSGLLWAEKAPPIEAKPAPFAADEKALLDLLNEARKKENLPPLKVNAVLYKVARLHSANMAKQEKMAYKLDGKGPRDRVDAAGYGCLVVRENLAAAEGEVDSPAPKPKEIHDKWMESKGNRATLLDDRVTDVGIAVVASKKGTYYYTLIAATPKLLGGGKSTPAEAKAAALAADEKALLDLLNEARKKEKLPPLKSNAVLHKVARLHSANMAKQEKMAHELDGKRVGDRTDAGGYDYGVVRENLAASGAEIDDSAPSPKEIHDGWMASKGHRANLLDARVTEAGIAIVVSKKGTYYYTQVFATLRK